MSTDFRLLRGLNMSATDNFFVSSCTHLESPVEKDTDIIGLKVSHGGDRAWVCDSALIQKAER